jgi:hypothetical protein
MKPYIKIDTSYFPVNGMMFTVWESTSRGLAVSLFEIGGTIDALDTFYGKQAELLRNWLEEESLDLTVEEDA